jgi:hypothetical protein
MNLSRADLAEVTYMKVCSIDVPYRLLGGKVSTGLRKYQWTYTDATTKPTNIKPSVSLKIPGGSFTISGWLLMVVQKKDEE